MSFRTRFLLFSSFLVLGTGCASEFKSLRSTHAIPCNLAQFRPSIDYALYETTVDVIHKHLSGLMAVKTMPDTSIRAVFQSEMGLTYFDFEWSRNGNFHARNVIDKMNKKAVITTLRKDFELMLMIGMDAAKAEAFSDGFLLFTRIPKENEYIYAITDSACIQLRKMEIASSRKAKVELYLYGNRDIPDSVLIDHKQFKFTISLKRIFQ